MSTPVHVAIIPDGNRRWAKSKGLAASFGHVRAGSHEHIKELFDEARALGIKYLSFWGFSTENWSRDKKEIENLFKVIKNAVKDWRDEAKQNRTRFVHMGRKDRLPADLISEVNALEEETKGFSDFNVLLCLDYGGRDEIVRAVNKAIAAGKKALSEEEFSGYLDSSGFPDPDLLIRTSGEKRTSGFMPFQSAYAELYFSDVHFPDFGAKELRVAVEEFSNRKRNFGK